MTKDQMSESFEVVGIPQSPRPDDKNSGFGLKYRVLRILLLFTGVCFKRYDNAEQSLVEKWTRIGFALGYLLISRFFSPSIY